MPQCECGTLHPEPARRRGCHECGTTRCPSCALEIDHLDYCRWCATSLRPAHAA